MQRTTLKAWFLVHKWTSLVCTVFLLLLCLTGLPLVFGEEIAHLDEPEVAAAPADAVPRDLDAQVRTALAQYPGDVPLFVGWDPDAPTVYVNTGARPDTPPQQMHTALLHAVSGEVLPAAQFNQGVMYFLYRLHTDLFLGLPGMSFMGAMGLLFAAAIVSGLVLYGPFMRRQRFGTLRTGRSRRLAWLDLHNVLGVVTLGWALVVGVTGAINTIAKPLEQAWQSEQLGEFAARYAGKPRPTTLAPLQAAVATARHAAPGMRPAFVSFPGTGYSGDHHYGVFMQGNTPLTERLYRPVLIDAQTGALTAQPQLPGYMSVLLLSQPLHFGDYGKLPLKILWALLDLLTIAVLVTGLYLWFKRGSTEARVSELERAAQTEAAP
ncbi:PepSY-associated TM helix domain-containing protein [Stenotrophomonas rhizophila]|uniref:PepSY-associated TM helix domain-containing protein n=1 Tax=Stenotrophomonas rhizophila TaxID=216778 RepID=UPI001E4DA51D|nr:PepSY-associated TM helix domain-containing protein [Stenotrophomonas rhizophila]MCC7635113.1 PepSY domain-containing protein [Stenotrophomonas rhizophila]MCC7664871.1 PepSY domain-containing protein [Stenotrophomonas rhizophila]